MENDRFKMLIDHYRDEFKMVTKETEKGLFGSSIAEDILIICKYLQREMENLKEKKFIDLGSGNGLVPNIFSFFCNAKGIEIDEELLDFGMNTKEKFSLDTEFVKKDFLEEDMSKYDIIFINPDQSLKLLEKKLLDELRGMFIVYSEVFRPVMLEKEKDFPTRVSCSIYRKNLS